MPLSQAAHSWIDDKRKSGRLSRILPPKDSEKGFEDSDGTDGDHSVSPPLGPRTQTGLTPFVDDMARYGIESTANEPS